MLHHPDCMRMSGMLLGVTAAGEKHVREARHEIRVAGECDP